jgi:hypothetical protein
MRGQLEEVMCACSRLREARVRQEHVGAQRMSAVYYWQMGGACLCFAGRGRGGDFGCVTFDVRRCRRCRGGGEASFGKGTGGISRLGNRVAYFLCRDDGGANGRDFGG